MKTFRVNLLLAGATLLVGSVLYPLAVYLAAQTAFPENAEGGILRVDGRPVGARLIARKFDGDEYFQPRPSAANYNAAASATSNLGANNPKLRDRVARQLGPIVRYRSAKKGEGKLVGEDIETWFKSRPRAAEEWLSNYPTSAAAWVDENKEKVQKWLKDHPEKAGKESDDLAPRFFAAFLATHPGRFPDPDKECAPVDSGDVIRSVFFESWLQLHPNADLELVPADCVTVSGSGLDPDITLANAEVQRERVAGRWAELTKEEVGALRREIDDLLTHHAHGPLAGTAGPQLVNVLEINLALRERFGPRVKTTP